VIPSFLYLYNCSTPPEFDIDQILIYLKKFLPTKKIEKREEFFSYIVKKQNNINIDLIAKEIALCRVHNLEEEIKEFSPLYGEIMYEKERITKDKQPIGVIYDGIRLQNLCRKFIEKEELSLNSFHIIFTNQLIATFEEADKRYHLRVGIYGFPNLISTSGLIEALAKPKEFYLKMELGLPFESLKREFKNEIIDYDDLHITELLKGYSLQALFYHIEGELFCHDKGCRLYNAHWQKEAIYAQILSNYELCQRHKKITSQWR
jgi:hypothetical protein